MPNVAPAAASAPRKQALRRVAARPVLMPSSTWNAMSALAGALPFRCTASSIANIYEVQHHRLLLDWQSNVMRIGFWRTSASPAARVQQCPWAAQEGGGSARCRVNMGPTGMRPADCLSLAPRRWHSAAAAGPSAERLSCCFSCPACACPEAGGQQQARSATVRGPGAAGERDCWGLSCQLLDRPLPGPPATGSQGPSASSPACNMILREDVGNDAFACAEQVLHRRHATMSLLHCHSVHQYGVSLLGTRHQS